MQLRRAGLLLLLSAASYGTAHRLGAQDAFRFLHFSDTHLPRPASERVLRQGLAWGAKNGVQLSLLTGDITEFGGRGEAWERYQSVFAGSKIPNLPVMGNHDATWDGLFDKVAGKHRLPYYVTGQEGIQFVGLCSGSLQDPRPSLGQDQLLWLARTLDGMEYDPRLILFLHHPPEGSEWAGRYELRRLEEILGGRSVVALLVGHGHGLRTGTFGNWPWIMGGSTFGKNAGFGEAELGCTGLTYRYHFEDPAKKVRTTYAQGMETATEPELVFVPVEAGADRHGFLRRAVKAYAKNGGLKLRWYVDEEAEPRKVLPGTSPYTKRYVAKIPLKGLVPGTHVLSVLAEDRRGKTRWALQTFEIEASANKKSGFSHHWSRQLPTAFTNAFALEQGRLCLLGKDGRLLILDAQTGKTIYDASYDRVCPGAVAALPDRGFVLGLGSELLAIDLDGKELWRRAMGAPLAAKPLVQGERILVADLRGRMHALSRGGEKLWTRQVADYAIEKGPVALDADRILVGAWDTKVRCLSAKDGSELWSHRSRGARGVAARYYSPADCPPALAAGRIFVADRKFELTVFDPQGEEIRPPKSKDKSKSKSGDFFKDVASLAASPEGDAVYLRATQGWLRRLDPKTLGLVWELRLPVGRTPTPPAVGEGYVLVRGERDGCCYLVDSETGKLLDTYRVQQALYPFAPLLLEGRTLFAAGLDGSVLSLGCP